MFRAAGLTIARRWNHPVPKAVREHHSGFKGHSATCCMGAPGGQCLGGLGQSQKVPYLRPSDTEGRAAAVGWGGPCLTGRISDGGGDGGTL